MVQLLSISQAIGAPVWGRADESIGRLQDAVARVLEPGDERFPPLTGLVVRVGGLGGHNVFVPWESVRSLSAAGVSLSSSRLDLRPFARRDGEILVAHDVLDKQVVDVAGRRVVRVNDVQLAPDPQHSRGWRVAAADVSFGGFVARVLPKSLAGRLPRQMAALAIPWDQVEFFASDVPDVKLRVEHTALARMHPVDIAALIEDLSYRQGEELLTVLDDPVAADVVEYLPSELQSAVLTTLPDEKAGDILDEMEPDDAADILAELPEDEAQDLLEAMEPDEAADVTRLLDFAPDTAGGLMTTDFIAVPESLTVSEVVDRLRETEDLPDLIPYVYVLGPAPAGGQPSADGAAPADGEPPAGDASHLLGDAAGGAAPPLRGRPAGDGAAPPDGAPAGPDRLKGVVTLRALLLARPEQRLADLARHDVLSVPADEPAQSAAEMLAHYDLIALPVIDQENRMLGVITVDDALDVLLPEEWKPQLPRIWRGARP